MFVSIDMDKLVFLHKHHDHETLSGLALLEAPNRSVVIENSEREGWFSGMSQLDMQILYKNTTGFDMAYKWVEVQQRMMQKLVGRLEPTLALAEEVAAQVAAVEEDLRRGVAYRYALGARVPAKAQELFPLLAKAFRDDEATDIARKAPPPPPTQAAPAAPPAADNTPAAAPKARTGSVRPVVRAAADQAWEAAGKPTGAEALKELTKPLIQPLEAQGYHPTTIRIKLSEWIKEHAI